VNATAHNLIMRRLSLWVATLATVALLTRLLAGALPADTPVLNSITLALFVVLTTWLVLWFWIAAVGAWHVWEQGGTRRIRLPPLDPEDAAALSRTAILMPVYNEEPHPVFARIRAMLESLRVSGHDSKFDFFVLSDTRDPDIWLEEEWHWLELQSELARPGAVYYRRRSENIGRKAGNIADFCEHWGADYRYMVVLDADSLMDAETFVELVCRMDADPQLGLLQTPTLPLGDRSLLSRCQQFAAKLCTPLLTEALEWFSADGGNYWGHNAIIRTAVFTRFCGLSELPGKPPLGGQILSHDFVEAALMQRAGYKVRLATDLTASYEECPSTLPLFAQRDQRWCQGNMQHARLIVSRRIPPSNRFHFATGVMAFVSSPLWLTFLVVGLLTRFVSAVKSADEASGAVPDPSDWYAIGVFAVVMLMLIAPRVWGALLAARDRKTLAGFGGAMQLIRSLLLEFIVSVFIAPIMMAFHTLFVASTLAGHRVEWNAQSRSETGVGWRQAWYAHRAQTIAGVLATIVTAVFIPDALPWLSPILVGLVLAIPISMLVSHAQFGEWLKARGLLQIPEEVAPPEILQLFECMLHDERSVPCAPRGTLFHQLLDDPIWLRSHLSMLAATNAAKPAPPQSLQECEALIRRGHWSELSKPLKQSLLADPAALAELHHTTWSMRSLELMAHERASVQIQPSVTEALANEGV
jgi:membrane glycosyltransferase